MGSTVTTGRRAAAFRSPTGKNIYVLFEETYEKNVTPHTPTWSCIGLGDLEATITKIFRYASSCEGGMLQNRSGHITPEGYLRTWMKELESPVEFRDQDIHLRFDTGWASSVPEESRQGFSDTLSALGRTDILDALIGGERVTLRFHQDIDLILSLYGIDKIAPWRIIRNHLAPEGDRNASLGYSPKPATNIELDIPAALRIDDHERLLQRADGKWYAAGWAYSIIENFIQDLGKVELESPGSFVKRIKAYRDAVENAPRIPLSSLKVVVDTSVPLSDEWDRRRVAELQQKFPVTATEGGFEVVPAQDALYMFTQLPRAATTWVVSPHDGSELLLLFVPCQHLAEVR